MRKKIILTLLFVTVLFKSAYAADNYTVNFNNVPMKDFVTFVSEFTGKNVIFNENEMRGNVTVASQKNMDAKEVLDIFYSVMKLNGYVPIVKGNNIQIVSENNMANYDEELTNNTGNRNSYSTTIINLKSYSAATILPVLNRMKSRTGFVEAIKGINVIVVRDSTSRINKMMTLINRVDRIAGAYKFYTIPLQYSIASKLEQQIVKFYNELEKSSIGGTSPVIVSDDISNTLIIAATEQDYKRISYLVSNIDTKNMAVNTEPRVFYLKNSKAEDVEKVLSKLVNSLTQTASTSKTGTTTAASSSSASKSNISSDNATNAIIAIGDKELYDNLESIINKLDVPRRQVYVEALILETSIDKSSEFGVEWFAAGADGTSGLFGSSGQNGNLGTLIGSIAQGGTPSIGVGSGLSLGVIGNIITFQGAKFPSIGALISALRSSAGINIISNPQILTLNNSEAEVFVGETIPYKTGDKLDANNNPVYTYDYRDVGVKLKVTPQISNNDTVTLTIEQEIKKISNSATSTEAPTTLTRTTKTTVKLQNHSIMVISGMIKDDTNISTTGIPILSQIPILGWLFKKESKTYSKSNVMLFITAHIIDTVEDSDKLLKEKQKALELFNREGDKEFSTGAFSDSGRTIKLKNDIDGFTPEEAAKTQVQRDREKAQREKAEQKAAKEREKARKKAEKQAEKERQNAEKQYNNTDETKLLTPASTNN